MIAARRNGLPTKVVEGKLGWEYCINAGFIVFERSAFDRNVGQSLERDVPAHLAARKAVYGYRHHGFFKSVDTYKDAMEFEELIEAGNMPWIVRS